MASGSLQFLEDGSWTKRLHAGWAAQAGLSAAMLAAAGVVAPNAPHTGRHGLFSLFLGAEGRATVDIGLATHDLPGACAAPVWEVHGIAVKPYAMCHFVHAATDAAIALHDQGIALDAVHDIEVLVPQAAVPLVCEPQARKRRPSNDYEAKFSLPYAVVCGLLRGRLDLQDLQPAAYQSADVQALMDRVRYSVDPDATFPRHYSGELRVTLADGTRMRHREAVNRGHAERPLSNAEVQRKFSANAALHFHRGWADSLMAQVLELQDLPQVRVLEDKLAQEP
jgi:2-methylcitrate dehydratase PrpD